jgi:uncharacterized glyoxalase superfamily protein PhnB
MPVIFANARTFSLAASAFRHHRADDRSHRGSMSPTPTVPAGSTHAEAEPFQGRTLSASLTVSDLQGSLSWYRDVAGFTVDREHARDGVLRAVSLRAGDVRILIGQDDGARGSARIKGEGFSLMITTAQDVDEIARGIEARGGTLEAEPSTTPWGVRMFRLRDPDGFKLVIASEG